jgi:competence ComEA-like helix-hairpin-helix protein
VMFNFTPEERKVTLFLLGVTLCGLLLNSLLKINSRVEAMVYPGIQLAKLDLNKVSLEELVATKRVSMKLARSILEYRNLRKDFSSLEQLKEVKGIGNQRYERLKELFFVE